MKPEKMAASLLALLLPLQPLSTTAAEASPSPLDAAGGSLQPQESLRSLQAQMSDLSRRMTALERSAPPQPRPVRRVTLRAARFYDELWRGETITRDVDDCRQAIPPFPIDLRPGESQQMLKCSRELTIARARHPDPKVARWIATEVAVAGLGTVEVKTTVYSKGFLGGRILQYHSEWAICRGRPENLSFRHSYDPGDGRDRLMVIELEVACLEL